MLERDELSRFQRGNPQCGWLVPFEHEGIHFDLHVLIPQDFPWERPRVYCRDKFEFQKFPHIEKDGAFCLYPPGTEHDPLNPRRLVQDGIKEAVQLIAASFDEAFLDDFSSEFESYWSKSDVGRSVVSLLSPDGSSRTVSLWRSTEDLYLADNEETLLSWLKSRFPSSKGTSVFETATHVVLERPIRPEEYPSSGAGILRIVKELAAGSADLIASTIESVEGKFMLSFEGHTSDGPVFFSVDVLPPTKQGMPAGRRPDMLQKGFRPGKVPQSIRLQRLLGGNPVERHEVMRADPSWVHGRDSAEIEPLFSKRVLMIGCGSLGSEVAQILAKAGIGSITLIDPELLDYPNVGRHALGVSEVGTWKSKSLAEKMRRNYPHMLSIESFQKRWQHIYDIQPEVFHEVDLIISTVGSWLAEARLNQVALGEPAIAPVLYGWAEPYSVAGHAVLVDTKNSCFACGMDQFGSPLRKACEWETDTTRKEPNCGASFQPYGPMSLASVVSLVAKTAVNALLGEIEASTETVYWASEAEIFEAGGHFSAEFREEFPESPQFGGTRSFYWEKNKTCPFCGDV